MDVGIRQLRDELSRHLATVRSGGTVTITDHGHPIARIVPVDAPSQFERLVAEGRITRAKAPLADAPQPVQVGATISDLVAEQRH